MNARREIGELLTEQDIDGTDDARYETRDLPHHGQRAIVDGTTVRCASGACGLVVCCWDVEQAQALAARHNAALDARGDS